MAVAIVLIVLALLFRSAIAAFGVTQTANAFRVDTGAELVFDVNKNTADITSILFKGVQYQASDKATHINSGLGSSSVSSTAVGTNYIVIKARSNGEPVTQYFIAKRGDSRIYLATDIKGEVKPGELRFLARLKKSVLPTGVKNPVADNAGGSAIEGKDVFLVGGQTRCKFFSSTRFIDDDIHSIHGRNVSVAMMIPTTGYETASGGPFMRDINNQGTSDQQEFYYYMNSGHLRTEPWRMGLKGPYALSFASGQQTGTFNTSFFAELNIPGFVTDAGRGRVSGTATGVPSKFQTVLHWHNAQNQYWTYADKSGRYTSPRMKPGTYTMTLYKQEFKVAESSVSVAAGRETSANIASTEKAYTPIWRVGEFDGQPFEFKNGDKFLTMHPSDSRMAKWGGHHVVGSGTAKDFPMAVFAKTGGSPEITFTLTQQQAAAGAKLRIATTLSFKGGRPKPTIGKWTGASPKTPRDLNSRGITRGGYRGFGEIYDFQVPASALVAGKNTLALGVYGTGDQAYLSANYILDAIEMVSS